MRGVGAPQTRQNRREYGWGMALVALLETDDFVFDISNGLLEVFNGRAFFAGAPDVFDGVAEVEVHVTGYGPTFDARRMLSVMRGVADEVDGMRRVWNSLFWH